MSDVSASKIVYSIGLIINVKERKFHANFNVENESSRERKFSGTKVPVTTVRCRSKPNSYHRPLASRL